MQLHEANSFIRNACGNWVAGTAVLLLRGRNCSAIAAWQCSLFPKGPEETQQGLKVINSDFQWFWLSETNVAGNYHFIFNGWYKSKLVQKKCGRVREGKLIFFLWDKRQLRGFIFETMFSKKCLIKHFKEKTSFAWAAYKEHYLCCFSLILVNILKFENKLKEVKV